MCKFSYFYLVTMVKAVLLDNKERHFGLSSKRAHFFLKEMKPKILIWDPRRKKQIEKFTLKILKPAALQALHTSVAFLSPKSTSAFVTPGSTELCAAFMARHTGSTQESQIRAPCSGILWYDDSFLEKFLNPNRSKGPQKPVLHLSLQRLTNFMKEA